MTEPPRRLIEVCTFEAANEMVIDDLAKLIAEAEERQRQAARATERNPTEERTRTVLGVLGAKASGWF